MNKRILLTLLVIFGIAKAQNLDLRILKACNRTTIPWWDQTMKGVSFSVYPAMPMEVGGVWIYGYAKHNKEMMRNAYRSAFAIGLANGISFGLKEAIRRDRPFVTYPNDITKRTEAGTSSFPSGHTTAAFATATALSLSSKKWYVVVPSYLYAGLVGYSRMRLGVHYPSDVLGGAAIGIGSGFLIWQIDKWIQKRAKSKTQQPTDK